MRSLRIVNSWAFHVDGQIIRRARDLDPLPQIGVGVYVLSLVANPRISRYLFERTVIA